MSLPGTGDQKRVIDGELTSSNNVIQGLWIGEKLSIMQQLSIASFIANGHQYHLYAYDEIANVPPGTILKDASAIVPVSRVFQNREGKTYAAFSDMFRYRLLWIRGGWWADLDLICLKPFDFVTQYVFSSEEYVDPDCSDSTSGRRLLEAINCGAIKAPKESELLAYTWNCCKDITPTLLTGWDQIGPDLLGDAVRKFNLTGYVRRPLVFCPVAGRFVRTLLSPQAVWDFGSDTYAVHLWHEWWRREGLDLDKQYHPLCLYEKLKKRYLERVS